MHYTANRRLKEYLKSKGVSQKDAARAMRMDRTYLNQVLNGNKPLNAYFLWYFWQTYVWEQSENFLPDAYDVLSEIVKTIAQPVRS